MPRELGRVSACPSIRTSPRSGASKPASMFISVDLPQPEGPTIATNSPSATSNEMPSTTGKTCPLAAEKLLRTSATAIFWTCSCIGSAHVAPPHGLHALEQSRDAVEQQADHADDDHAGD